MDKVNRVRSSPELNLRRVDKSVAAGSKGEFEGRKVRQGEVGQGSAPDKQQGASKSKKGHGQKPPALDRRSLENPEVEVQGHIDEAKKRGGFYELSLPKDLETLSDPVRVRLGQLLEGRPDIGAVLKLATEHGLRISASAGPGESVSLNLHVGTMVYPVFPTEEAPAQIESLNRLLEGYTGGHIILDWCVGNQLQCKNAYLCNALNSHQDIIDASRGDVELTVHTAGYQSRWNTDIIRRHFEGFPSRSSTQPPPNDTQGGGQPTKKVEERRVLGPTADKLYPEESKRYRDSLAYKEQTVALRRSSTKKPSGGKPSSRREETNPPSETGEPPTQSALASTPESPVRSNSRQIRSR